MSSEGQSALLTDTGSPLAKPQDDFLDETRSRVNPFADDIGARKAYAGRVNLGTDQHESDC